MDTDSFEKDFTAQELVLPAYLADRPADSHKGYYGHALLVAGSFGKMGAAVLAARACLRSGVGLLTVHVPRCGVDIMQTAVPEAMLEVDSDEECFAHAPQSLDRYDAIAVGPGLGTSSAAEAAMEELLRSRQGQPLVIDADGLNLLARHPEWRPLVRGSMLTPHAAEFARLFGPAVGEERDRLHRDMALAMECDILLKGHHSRVALRSGEVYVNTTGNAGMATAGSGDVLTGIVLGLCAQRQGFEKHGLDAGGLSELPTAVYIHGKSADLAVRKQSKASLVASDIVENLKYAIL